MSQDSLTAVTVTLTGGDSRCISLYFVEITEIGSNDSPTIISSSFPSIGVTGLDLCIGTAPLLSALFKLPQACKGEEVHHK